MNTSEYPCGAPAPHEVRGMYTPDHILRQYAGQRFCADGLHWLVECNSHGRCFVLTTGACPLVASQMAPARYTFDTFRESEQPAAFATAEKFARHPKSVGNMIFEGRPGLGKTHLAKAIIADCRIRGRSTELVTRTELHDLFTKAQPSHDHAGERYEANDKLDRIRKADVVVFDDFGGVGTLSAFFVEQFRTLLDALRGTWILTTNKTKPGMAATYDDGRIISRLYQTAQLLAFDGHDQRTKPRPAELIGTAE